MNKVVTIEDLEIAARSYSAMSKILRDLNEELNDKIDAVKRDYMEKIKVASRDAGEAYQMLYMLVEAGKNCFSDKKKSFNINGVKFGYKKQKGRLEIADESKSIQLLRKYDETVAELAIKNKESIIKDVLSSQPADLLKKIGVAVTDDTDIAFVSLTDSEIQKLIEAMIKESAKFAE